jgi:alpha-galactosidase/6-phospho-beta-glucosidase family protein
MRGLRTIPVLVDMCREMEELCPDALLLPFAARLLPGLM